MNRHRVSWPLWMIAAQVAMLVQCALDTTGGTNE